MTLYLTFIWSNEQMTKNTMGIWVFDYAFVMKYHY